MSDDERFARSVWKDAHLRKRKDIRDGMCSTVVMSGGQTLWYGNAATAWSAARQFTESRIKEVEDVREETMLLRGMVALLASERGDMTAPVYRRTLTRLRAEQSRLTQGMRPEYVAERGWAQ